MPTGEMEVESEDIVLERVSREHQGTYECVAQDDSGLQPVTKDVEVFVECKLRIFTLNNYPHNGCFAKVKIPPAQSGLTRSDCTNSDSYLLSTI